MNTQVANAEVNVAKPAGFLQRVWAGYQQRAERAAMARLAALDPRLSREIQAARDRMEWKG